MWTWRQRALVAGGSLVIAGSLLAGSLSLVVAQTPPANRPGGMEAGGTPGMMGQGGMMGAQPTPGPTGAAGDAGGAGMGQMMQGMMGDGALTAGPSDQWFIQEMIPHHADAVSMADLAHAQAEHAEVKSLATQLRSAQTAEIAQLRTWYGAWFGAADVPEGAMAKMHDAMRHGMGTQGAAGAAGMPAMPGMMGQGSTTMMGQGGTMGARGMGAMHQPPASLDGAVPFDKAFIEQMVPHHQMAVMMAAVALSSADHPELQALLQTIISSQSAEIRQMRGWYAQWYPAS